MKLMERQNSLYGFSLLLIFAVTIFSPGCGASSSNVDTSRQYMLKAGKVDNFYVLSSDLDGARKPRYMTYLFSGQLRNNTENLYANGTIKMKVSISLENGIVLEEKDLNYIPFNNILSHKFFHNWKPGETVNINKIVSISIPVEYADYPVKDVVLEYSLDLEDKISQTDEEVVIATVSVIDKWNLAVKKVKSGKVDTEDNNFPDRILNKVSNISHLNDRDKKELIDE